MYIGIDIVGTKCAVILGDEDLNIVKKVKFATTTCEETLERIFSEVAALPRCDGIGISCGGPLDEERGVILSPPNLPGWDHIEIVKLFQERLGIPTAIQNDANACALAEWTFGAGVGTQNMVFLTFGTGLGAGLILNGKLYAGTNDNAGEVGHIRLNDYGPVGYGKSGSFEGFCSGGGIRQLAISKAKERLQMGLPVSWCPDGNVESINARIVAEAAREGDELALGIYRDSALQLGRGLAFLIDILNPERIVIGSIYTRCEDLMAPFVA
jgi:glucokinase